MMDSAKNSSAALPQALCFSSFPFCVFCASSRPILSPSTTRPVFGEQDLLGLTARRRLPIERPVHRLAHLFEPPVGARQALFAPRRARAPVHRSQTQFQLILICHIHMPFVLWVESNG